VYSELGTVAVLRLAAPSTYTLTFCAVVGSGEEMPNRPVQWAYRPDRRRWFC